jgi:hypothetical protein
MTDFEGSTRESKARDGISHDYFPLTAREQAKYNFSVGGTETLRGRTVYRVRFEPKPHDGRNLGRSTWISTMTMTTPRGRALCSSMRPNTSPSG